MLKCTHINDNVLSGEEQFTGPWMQRCLKRLHGGAAKVHMNGFNPFRRFISMNIRAWRTQQSTPSHHTDTHAHVHRLMHELMHTHDHTHKQSVWQTGGCKRDSCCVQEGGVGGAAKRHTQERVRAEDYRL